MSPISWQLSKESDYMVPQAGLWPTIWPTARKSEPIVDFVPNKTWPDLQGNKMMGAAGFEPATSRV
jgi:hypothetical protein